MQIRTYHELPVDAPRGQVKAALTGIVQAFALPATTRKSLVQVIINDVHTSISGDDEVQCRLDREDASLALSALKSLGRNPDASTIIASSENLSLLLAIEKALRSTDVEAANEALRCIANALLLIESSRDTWTEVGGAAYCEEQLKIASTPIDIFLLSRILFLSTASATSPFLETLVSGLSESSGNIIQTIGSRLEVTSSLLEEDKPYSREAMVDLLKFTFNLVCHAPKFSLISESNNGSRGIGIGITASPGLGERWDERLDGILEPLLKVFVRVPFDTKNPLAPPVSHILHALIAVPANDTLGPIWLMERYSCTGEGVNTPKGKEKAPEDFVTTQAYHRALKMFETSLEHYFPGNVDPDEKSVRDRIAKEDENLSHTLCPIVLLVTKFCYLSSGCRAHFRSKIIPPDLDRTSPLEQRSDTLGRCIRLMSAVYYNELKDAIGELLYTACESDANILSGLVGYGNVAGFLFNKGIAAPPPKPEEGDKPQIDLEFGQHAGDVNPITGMINSEEKPVVEMTDEEKEREAEKLFVLFERMEKITGMENPIKKAFHEGKLEKYAESSQSKKSD